MQRGVQAFQVFSFFFLQIIVPPLPKCLLFTINRPILLINKHMTCLDLCFQGKKLDRSNIEVTTSVHNVLRYA